MAGRRRFPALPPHSKSCSVRRQRDLVAGAGQVAEQPKQPRKLPLIHRMPAQRRGAGVAERQHSQKRPDRQTRIRCRLIDGSVLPGRPAAERHSSSAPWQRRCGRL